MISSLTKKFLSFVFTLVLVCPFLVFAQSNNDDERNFVEDQINKINQVSSAINQETMTIDLSPSTPKTGDTVTASLTTPGIDLDQAKITWYIKNISPNHVVISDLELTINRGKTCDALRNLTPKQIEKSRDFKEQLNINNLKRLTEKEYVAEIEKNLIRHPVRTGIK
jgi:hypothetical protein